MARRLAIWLLVALFVPSIAGSALADTLRGTAEEDRLDGTPRDDTIRGRAGDDTLTGRRGDDVLIGGPGADALAGGRGDDRCLTDASDPTPIGCEEVVGPAGPLVVTATTGADRCIVLRRSEDCYFVIEGMGADAETGSVTGSGGVRVMPPTGEVSARDGRWNAYGTYACDADGALSVTIGAESAWVPVSCA